MILTKNLEFAVWHGYRTFLGWHFSTTSVVSFPSVGFCVKKEKEIWPFGEL
jgi:hypothetical protein